MLGEESAMSHGHIPLLNTFPGENTLEQDTLQPRTDLSDVAETLCESDNEVSAEACAQSSDMMNGSEILNGESFLLHGELTVATEPPDSSEVPPHPPIRTSNIFSLSSTHVSHATEDRYSPKTPPKPTSLMRRHKSIGKNTKYPKPSSTSSDLITNQYPITSSSTSPNKYPKASPAKFPKPSYSTSAFIDLTLPKQIQRQVKLNFISQNPRKQAPNPNSHFYGGKRQQHINKSMNSPDPCQKSGVRPRNVISLDDNDIFEYNPTPPASSPDKLIKQEDRYSKYELAKIANEQHRKLQEKSNKLNEKLRLVKDYERKMLKMKTSLEQLKQENTFKDAELEKKCKELTDLESTKADNDIFVRKLKTDMELCEKRTLEKEEQLKVVNKETENQVLLLKEQKRLHKNLSSAHNTTLKKIKSLTEENKTYQLEIDTKNQQIKTLELLVEEKTGVISELMNDKQYSADSCSEAKKELQSHKLLLDAKNLKIEMLVDQLTSLKERLATSETIARIPDDTSMTVPKTPIESVENPPCPSPPSTDRCSPRRSKRSKSDATSTPAAPPPCRKRAKSAIHIRSTEILERSKRRRTPSKRFSPSDRSPVVSRKKLCVDKSELKKHQEANSLASITQADTKQSLAKDILPKAVLPKETSATEARSKEVMSNETLVKETISKETIAKETISKETIAKETISKETIAKEMVPKETIAKETISKETITKETILKETISKETLSKEAIYKAKLQENLPDVTKPEGEKAEESDIKDDIKIAECCKVYTPSEVFSTLLEYATSCSDLNSTTDLSNSEGTAIASEVEIPSFRIFSPLRLIHEEGLEGQKSKCTETDNTENYIRMHKKCQTSEVRMMKQCEKIRLQWEQKDKRLKLKTQGIVGIDHQFFCTKYEHHLRLTKCTHPCVAAFRTPILAMKQKDFTLPWAGEIKSFAYVPKSNRSDSFRASNNTNETPSHITLTFSSSTEGVVLQTEDPSGNVLNQTIENTTAQSFTSPAKISVVNEEPVTPKTNLWAGLNMELSKINLFNKLQDIGKAVSAVCLNKSESYSTEPTRSPRISTSSSETSNSSNTLVEKRSIWADWLPSKSSDGCEEAANISHRKTLDSREDIVETDHSETLPPFVSVDTDHSETLPPFDQKSFLLDVCSAKSDNLRTSPKLPPQPLTKKLEKLSKHMKPQVLCTNRQLPCSNSPNSKDKPS